MRKALTIAMLRLRLVLKNRGNLIAMFGMPLIFTLIFGGLNSGVGSVRTYPIAILDEDGSVASKLLVDRLQQEKSLRVKVITAEEVDRLFADRAVVLGVTVPKGFQQGVVEGTTPDIKLTTAPGTTDKFVLTPVVTREVSRVALDFRVAHASAGNPSDPSSLQKRYDEVTAKREQVAVRLNREVLAKQEGQSNSHPFNETALGFTVMFVMMSIFMSGGAILRDRAEGTWGRLLITPTPKPLIMFGYVFSFYVVGVVQFAGLVVLTRLLFKVDWGPILPLAALASAFILCAAGLGMFVAGLVKTAAQQQAAGTIIVVATSMLGGVYWPLDMVGDTMRRIGYLTPQAWAMDGLREVMLRGGSFPGLVWPLAVLGSLAVVFMTAGVVRLKA